LHFYIDRREIPLTETYYAGKMPILALRGLTVFPEQTVHFDVGRKKSILALEKAMNARGEREDNLRFVIGDARNLADWFPAHSVDCIYLNFSDPWPKKGYAKRRLTHCGFLELYRRILKPGGVLKLKTDNEGLFDFSLEQFALSSLEIEWQTRDLHRSEKNADNIMTEYERSFSQKGQVIYSAWVRF
jgi:tRNA (guanine-N7-)-methyltransferase